MKLASLYLIGSLAFCGTAAIPSSANGALIMESFTSGTFTSTSFSRGWRFRPNIDLTATGLAMFDPALDGLAGSGYDVHLWTDAGVEP